MVMGHKQIIATCLNLMDTVLVKVLQRKRTHRTYNVLTRVLQKRLQKNGNEMQIYFGTKKF